MCARWVSRGEETRGFGSSLWGWVGLMVCDWFVLLGGGGVARGPPEQHPQPDTEFTVDDPRAIARAPTPKVQGA